MRQSDSERERESGRQGEQWKKAGGIEEGSGLIWV